jgi:hypothetical protein
LPRFSLGKRFQDIFRGSTSKSENCNLATMVRVNRRRFVLLQTLRIRDPDELAAGFRRWELRFRQLGGGSFQGELKFLHPVGTQIHCASGNRRLHAQGSLPPGSFGFAPIVPKNAGAIWRGRHCKTGQVVTIDRLRKAST